VTTTNTVRSHRALQKRYGIGSLSLAAVLGIGCVLAGWPSVGKGIVLGTVFSAANFILMGEGVVLKFVSGGGNLLPLVIMVGRYALLALPIIVAIKLPAFDLRATVVGVFMVQACIVTDAIVSTTRKDQRQPPAST